MNDSRMGPGPCAVRSVRDPSTLLYIGLRVVLAGKRLVSSLHTCSPPTGVLRGTIPSDPKTPVENPVGDNKRPDLGWNPWSLYCGKPTETSSSLRVRVVHGGQDSTFECHRIRSGAMSLIYA